MFRHFKALNTKAFIFLTLKILSELSNYQVFIQREDLQYFEFVLNGATTSRSHKKAIAPFFVALLEDRDFILEGTVERVCMPS